MGRRFKAHGPNVPLHRRRGKRILPAVTTQMTCPVCRAEIPTGSAFCPACGNPSPTVITNERAAPPPAPTAVPTAERLARALGAKYQGKRLGGRGRVAAVHQPWEQEPARRPPRKGADPDIPRTPRVPTPFR